MMITKIYGLIEDFSPRGVNLRVGGLVYEVFLMLGDKERLMQQAKGTELSLHTLFFMEGGGFSGGGQSPALVGFLRVRDREFFELFTSVEGIGVNSALKMLSVPVPYIARAIEENDLRFLCTLKQVGNRTARKIVASLTGKVKAYTREEAGEEDDQGRGPGGAGYGNLVAIQTTADQVLAPLLPDVSYQKQLKAQATAILEQLGYSTGEVKRMLTKVFEAHTDFKDVEEVLAKVYK